MKRQLLLSPLAVLVVVTGAWAGQVRVDQVHVKNNSAGDAIVNIEYDCDKNENGVIDKKEEYACRLSYARMEGNQNVAAGQDNMIGESDIGNKLADGTRFGLVINNGYGQNCRDRHPPDGDDVIYDTKSNNKIQFKVTGDAIAGISCHFQKDKKID